MHLQRMSIQKMSVFHHKLFLNIFLNYFLMFQCNEHVEMLLTAYLEMFHESILLNC